MIKLIDEQLILIARRNYDVAFDYLSNKYLLYGRKLIGRFINQKNIKNYRNDEFLYIFYNSLGKAIKTFSSTNNTFLTYFKKVLLRDLNNATNAILVDIVKLKNPVFLDYLIDNDTAIGELIEDKHVLSPKDYVDYKDAFLRLSSKNETIKKHSLQKQIIILKYKGYTLKEISKKLNIDVGAVRRILLKDDDGTPLNSIRKILA